MGPVEDRDTIEGATDELYKISNQSTAHVIGEYPDLNKFAEKDGCLYTILKKTMYGCIQASSLWYRLLKKVLEEFGFEMSERD
jgi:hypothetical protein